MALTGAQRQARYRAKHLDRLREVQRESYYKPQNKERIRTYAKAFTQRAKKAVYDLLGTECTRCGFSDIRALQIDHVKGDGHRERKTITRNFYKVVLEEILNGNNKYQILCANCNWIKRSENNELSRKN